MEPLKPLNLAMQYIEEHLAEELDMRKIAMIACCSEYHFRRMFASLSGMALNEYIRKRRLTLAALELNRSDMKVVDAALKYGYESPDSFARAFQSFHGLTPTEARGSGAALQAVPPMTFQLTIRGGNAMEYRIVEKEAFRIVGLKKRVKLLYNGVNPEIDAMWRSLTAEDIEELKSLSRVEPRGLISGSFHFEEGRAEGQELEHLIGVATNEPYTGKWQTHEVPATTWAVFTAVGKFPDELQNVWARIFSEWFAMSGYELGEGPEILWNESKDTALPDFHSEIWIPVVRQQPSNAATQ